MRGEIVADETSLAVKNPKTSTGNSMVVKKYEFKVKK
jgi:hypothetical protein